MIADAELLTEVRANARNGGPGLFRIDRIADQSLGAPPRQHVPRLRRFRRTQQSKHTVPVLFQTENRWASTSPSGPRQ